MLDVKIAYRIKLTNKPNRIDKLRTKRELYIFSRRKDPPRRYELNLALASLELRILEPAVLDILDGKENLALIIITNGPINLLY